MEKIFFIIGVLIVFKYLLSVVLICNKLKVVSYVTEVLISLCMIYIAYKFTEVSLLIFVAEYFISKLLVFINIVLIKTICFRWLIAITHNALWWKICGKMFNQNKLCHNLKHLYQIDYGVRLKHGLPAMAKRTHKKTGIKFDRNGFPKFESYYNYRINFWDLKKSRETHFYQANRHLYKKALKSIKIRQLFNKFDLQELKKGDTPDKYTWHHHQNRGKMQLVLRDIHSNVSHIGGYSIWGKEE